MKKIICNLNMFSMQQSVCIIDLDTNNILYSTSVSMDELPKVISSLSNEYSVPWVSLVDTKVHGDKLAHDIVEYTKINYSNNNIEIEVI